MVSFMTLPKALLLLLLTSPILTVSVALPSSKNDPFRAIVLVHHKRQPEPPLCCLTPPPSIEPPDDVEDVLLSFEEWKSKQLQSQSQPQSQTQPQATAHPKIDALEHMESSTTHEADVAVPDPSTYLQETELSPHFRVPITDRFNYANLDCSARVHTSHRSARSPSSILSSKKDKYMLSPCSSGKEEQFVVVELCEDIRIDTVQLANFEFFSGVFKDFSVKVAKTYTTSDDGWVLAGTYKGKNIRGVQSFHTPTTLRDFYRYIRVDFHSHYGHEYYCPVSLLRVYGLTHLEQWKWDIWEEESHALARAQVQAFSSIAEPLPISSGGSELNKFMDELEARNIPSTYPLDAAHPTIKAPSTSHTSLSNSRASNAVNRTSSSLSSSCQTKASGRPQAAVSSSAIILTDSAIMQQPTSSPPSKLKSVSSSETSTTSSLDTSVSSVSSNESSSAHSPDLISPEVPHTSSIETSLSQSSPSPSHHVPSANTMSTALPTPPLVGSSGESIYRTIMTRLTLLEANHSLYARYVEEQTAGVREVLRRLGEDAGRLESVSRIQAQMYQRTVHEWERQRLRLEFEHGELLSRVNYLAEEVTLEKRLGIAQLCLLLAVLVFMGLTRGAPSIEHPQLSSAKEWGRRNLSFASSNNEHTWNNLKLRSRSPPAVPVDKRSATVKDHSSGLNSRVDFPSHRTQRSSDHDTIARRPPHFTTLADKRSTPRGSTTTKRSGTPLANFALRTPTRRIPASISTEISTLPRAHMVRTNSHSSTGLIIPKSVKRLARTAHLHEVKGSLSRRESQNSKPAERENDDDGDVFRVPPVKTHHYSRHLSSPRQPLFPLGLSRQPKDVMAGDTNDADAWVDTDLEGGSECSELAAFDPSF
ncbi:UNC-like C-terminal-domain-containing protein [Suillus clintonianus]|uniref:UNC-like C-terminal-domain-containing protein n=1 Tax=Suillus clintonianus TaxID=1904413 RepID=UPI001B874CFD|nr:UNC-like C-terminal-domain-containing protein [Suillus clintonianus]KAG2126550.1 UNC-like C-terminal-domain-containing protein [Suillus clintonianus]